MGAPGQAGTVPPFDPAVDLIVGSKGKHRGVKRLDRSVEERYVPRSLLGQQRSDEICGIFTGKSRCPLADSHEIPFGPRIPHYRAVKVGDQLRMGEGNPFVPPFSGRRKP